MRFSQVVYIFLGICVTVGGNRGDLICYQCVVEDNSLCTEEDLKPCPKDEAHDVCVTILKKTALHGFHIEKKCGLGPCTLSRDRSFDPLGLDTCDRTRDEFECMSCCQGNACNKDGAAITYVNLFSLIFCLFISFKIKT